MKTIIKRFAIATAIIAVVLVLGWQARLVSAQLEGDAPAETPVADEPTSEPEPAVSDALSAEEFLQSADEPKTEGEPGGGALDVQAASSAGDSGSGSITIHKRIRTNETQDDTWSLPWSFDFTGNLGDFTLTNVDSQKAFGHLEAGTYTFTEENIPSFPGEGQSGWYLLDIKCAGTAQENISIDGTTVTINLPEGGEAECHFVNTFIPALPNPENNATVVAQKIVCTNEADLPDDALLSGWNHNGSPLTPVVGDNQSMGAISETTAKDWIATHASCSLVDNWNFEWSRDGVPNPGDNAGATGGDWHLFGPTVNGEAGVAINLTDNPGKLWFREVFQDGYIPFTGTTNPLNTEVSAEFYCNNDALNYDNWEWIDNLENGKTYYCVAWNVPANTDNGGGGDNGGGDNGGGDSGGSSGGGGGGGGSHHSNNGGSNQSGSVAGSSTAAPEGLVLGASVGLPNTGRAEETDGTTTAVAVTLLAGIITLAGLNIVSFKALKLN